MISFDPSECIRGIQQLLVSDKKRIAFLFGAGTSLARKCNHAITIPAVGRMTEDIITKIQENTSLASAVAEIKEEILACGNYFTIETLLTRIEEKKNVIGNGNLNGLTRDDFIMLERLVKSEIQNIVSVHKSIPEDSVNKMVQYDFASWIRNADRKYAVEIFTTNYDYLLEMGLECNDVPYYDGFVGSYKPFFNADSLEDINYLPQQTKLWKIHGSLGLHQDSRTEKIIRMPSDSEDLLIYPSALKYSHSKKQPYTAFMDRLNTFLKQDDAVLFVCGYSFGDEHINERITSALRAKSTAHIFVFYYDITWELDQKCCIFSENCALAMLARKNRNMSVFASRSAVIGTKYGTWKLKREPDKNDTLNVQWFFDEDAPINNNAPINKEIMGGESWTGEGEFTLIDFAKFTHFLQKMIPKTEWQVITDD